jgi:hypothetical protein
MPAEPKPYKPSLAFLRLHTHDGVPVFIKRALLAVIEPGPEGGSLIWTGAHLQPHVVQESTAEVWMAEVEWLDESEHD